MPLMNWEPSLDIGVAEMNDDHKEILAAMNEIFDAVGNKATGSVVVKLVDKLGKICVDHFAVEEEYMASIGFPGLETHKIIHKKLLADYSAFAAAIKAANGKPSEDFFHFLKRWLTAHIKGIDVKYAEHARRGAAA